MPNIEAPTGDEEVQKYYGSSYLDQVDAVKAEVTRAAATGDEPDLEGFNPIDVSAVAPHFLTEEQKNEVVHATSFGSNVEGNLHPTEGMSMPEANGDEETRVSHAQQQVKDLEHQSATGEEPKAGEPEKSFIPTGVDSNIEGTTPVGTVAGSSATSKVGDSVVVDGENKGVATPENPDTEEEIPGRADTEDDAPIVNDDDTKDSDDSDTPENTGGLAGKLDL